MPTLGSVRDEVLACTRCPLAESRTNVVFGMGNPDADLLFIGEGPGAEEDKQGLPFVGRSGQLLDKLVAEEMGLTRDDVYIANVVKCLRYDAPVQLGDGSWERIGRLVRSRYGGEVMSVDATGALVPKRVVGWHASPLAGRRVFSLRYRSAKRAGATGRVGVHLTGDHQVMTERGWVAVQELTPADRVAIGQGLSEVAFDVVCGTLLGDGHLHRTSAHLAFTHGEHQADYARFKASLVAELGVSETSRNVAAVVGGDRAYDVVSIRTRTDRALRLLESHFYVGPRKVVPQWLAARLTPRALAIWFLDDGHTRIRPGRRPIAEIATNAFDARDLGVLIAALDRLGITASARAGRLRFGVEATRRLSEVIAPFVPPSMRYKLDPETEATVAFDPARSVPGRRLVMYDDVEAVDITDQPRTDSTFFCIDVEDTHNFVTAGGVVHNCRPPGNRDPLPGEIEACNPWLELQLDLIAPKVVVTLGNFSTRLLLDTTEGITNLRGRTYPYRDDSVLVPTFHPAAVLRGGATPMAQMRADLVRAKLALEAAHTTATATST